MRTWKYDWHRETDHALDCEVFELRAKEYMIRRTPGDPGEKRSTMTFQVVPTGREFRERDSISGLMLAVLPQEEAARQVVQKLTHLMARVLVKVTLTKELSNASPELAASIHKDAWHAAYPEMRKHFRSGQDGQDDKTLEACKEKSEDVSIEGHYGSKCRYVFKDKMPPFDGIGANEYVVAINNDAVDCDHCFGTGLLHGFQAPCPAGCPPKT